MKIDNSPINWWKVFGGFIIVLIIVSMIQNCNNPKPNTSDVSKSQIENEYNSKNEDSLYKAYKISYRLLKNNLKDSDSFDEIEHKRYFIAKKKKKENTHIQIYIKYRAKNSFGEYVIEEKYFNYDKNLNLINPF
jgi:hypothetical protein